MVLNKHQKEQWSLLDLGGQSLLWNMYFLKPVLCVYLPNRISLRFIFLEESLWGSNHLSEDIWFGFGKKATSVSRLGNWLIHSPSFPSPSFVNTFVFFALIWLPFFFVPLPQPLSVSQVFVCFFCFVVLFTFPRVFASCLPQCLLLQVLLGWLSVKPSWWLPWRKPASC